MTKFIKTFHLERLKLKKQHILLITFLMTAIVTLYLLWPGTSAPDSRIHYVGEFIRYYREQAGTVMVISLIIPILMGVIISRLADLEHKGNTWKLLETNNQDFKALWDVKFIITFLLAEISTGIIFISVIVNEYITSFAPIPWGSLCLNFLMLSLVNFSNLVILEIISMNFKNQLLVLLISLIIGMVNIMSPLMPIEIVKFLPCAYYTLCILSGSRMLYRNSAGLAVWEYYSISPSYLPIIVFFIVAVLLYFFGRKFFIRKDLT